MAILTVNNIPFDYPDPGSEQGTYGQDAADWAAEVTAVLASLVSPGDILETTSTITNNTVLATDVSGLSFSSSVVRAANVDYTIIRSSTGPTISVVESGTMYITYNTIDFTWSFAQTKYGNAGVTFSITSLGQVQYISSAMSATGYVGILTFKARTLGQ
jgi:hypothetical protein